ncbi:hypothetical protein [Microcoleus sp. B4-D4]|uniref:hypothetical protein n=1 Tax=Microcoleus sp. B4-D4 TaxID=2818667 RepID=UPI002FCE6FE2
MENSTSVCTTLGDRTSNLAKIGRSEAEGWGMGNGEWGMGNGEWGMGNGEWGMGNGAFLILSASLRSKN